MGIYTFLPNWVELSSENRVMRKRTFYPIDLEIFGEKHMLSNQQLNRSVWWKVYSENYAMLRVMKSMQREIFGEKYVPSNQLNGRNDEKCTMLCVMRSMQSSCIFTFHTIARKRTIRITHCRMWWKVYSVHILHNCVEDAVRTMWCWI